MSDAAAQEKIILKVLSGVQAGAEVSLPAGDYAIGSGPNDDLQFVDVSLKPGHARVRVGAGKMEVMALGGSLATSNGLSLGAGSDTWQELEPLDIVTIGTIRFALGAPSANWTSLNDMADDQSEQNPRAKRRKLERRPVSAMAGGRFLQLVLPLLFLAVVGAGVWYLIAASRHGGQEVTAERRNDVDVLREAFDKFPFGKAVNVKQEVDGTIYASGYVESPVERRALVGTAEKLGEPVRFRVNVLQTMRSEVDNLIKSAKVPLTFNVDANGVLGLDGLILKDDIEKKFVEEVKSDVIGISSVDDRIRTAKTLLSEIEKLTKMAQIDSYVVVRLDNDLIEVNGVLPVDKIDAWVGFLQSYTRRFSKDIALRSFVQLQNAAGAIIAQADLVPGQAIVLGERRPGSNDVVLDIERLKRGLFDLSDVFVGVGKRQQVSTNVTVGTDPSVPAIKAGLTLNPGGNGASDPAAKPGDAPVVVTPAVLMPPVLPISAISIDETPSRGPGMPGLPRVPGNGGDQQAAGPGGPGSSPIPGGPLNSPVLVSVTNDPNDPASANPGSDARLGTGQNGAVTGQDPAKSVTSGPVAGKPERQAEEIADLIARANGLIRGWLMGTPNPNGSAVDNQRLRDALDQIAVTRASLDADRSGPKKVDRATLANRYLPLIPDAAALEPTAANVCWPGSRLTPQNLPVALFWLDLLSVSSSLSIEELSRDQQGFILEAALNPAESGQCLQRAKPVSTAAQKSIYLAEAGRNPDFIRFITRNLKSSPMEVSGANLAGTRYIQTRDGYKMREGMAPDGLSRIAMVGELGVALRQDGGYSTVIYGKDLNWMLSQN